MLKSPIRHYLPVILGTTNFPLQSAGGLFNAIFFRKTLAK